MSLCGPSLGSETISSSLPDYADAVSLIQFVPLAISSSNFGVPSFFSTPHLFPVFAPRFERRLQPVSVLNGAGLLKA